MRVLGAGLMVNSLAYRAGAELTNSKVRLKRASFVVDRYAHMT